MGLARCEFRLMLLFPLILALAVIPSRADEPQPAASVNAKKQSEMSAAAEAASAASISGPKDVELAKQATLHLPEGFFFVPQPQAGKLSHALGNASDPRMTGIITGGSESDWIVFLDYLDDGHVKDDDAKTWNADELLQNLKDGTESGNADRQSRGFEPLEVAGWIEKPAYDAAEHRMVWSALVQHKGAQNQGGSANYNTYALGRSGHFELNLVSNKDTIENNKPIARQLLQALQFDSGNRYQDFNPATDHMAEYGLAALVGGIAAKKLGVLAVMAGFGLKFAKLIAIGAAAAVAGVKSLFKRGGSRQA